MNKHHYSVFAALDTEDCDTVLVELVGYGFFGLGDLAAGVIAGACAAFISAA